ncbi:AMP-dependent synthetase/ligase [Patulibacter minatonensis]|uniref:AMP-dependent synthetase/ligase n=1 Tax=Patulibacter minatonensis TaxID=298163 RepID=UPI00055AFF52|nr:long-chain fatty acid--CoA ligase [Patulibacter minatonensis]
MSSAVLAEAAADWPTLEAPSLCAAFQQTAAARPDEVALRTPGGDVEITWSAYADRVRSIAGGLASLGVQAGDIVLLMLTNRPEFHLVDTAVMHLGAVTVSIYNTYPEDEIRGILNETGARVVVSESAFVDRVAGAAGDGVQLVMADDASHPGTITLGDLEGRGPVDPDFDATWRAVDGDSELTLIYTSGTTGPPKAVRCLHRTMMFPMGSLHRVAPIGPDGRVVSFLPFAHIAERYFSHYAAMVFGFSITCCADPAQLGRAVAEVHPTRFFSPPRVYEKVMSGLQAAIADLPPDEQQTTRAAIEVGYERVRAEQTGGGVSAELAARHARADDEVLLGLRRRIGLDVVEWISVGAAPTPYHVLEFFHAIGVRIAEFWGMSECLLALANPTASARLGTVGRVVPGVEVMLADDGEILVRGENVMPGYRNAPEKTREAIDPAGWLHSGDIATQDEDGYVSIVDRKKEIIINSAGKNMSPSRIESLLKGSSDLIGQAVCVGDGRNYNVALLVLDPEASRAWARQNDRSDATVEELATDQAVRDLVAEAVERANGQLARVEQIKYHELLGTEWVAGGEELTPTSKIRRRTINEKYADVIEGMYASGERSTAAGRT